MDKYDEFHSGWFDRKVNSSVWADQDISVSRLTSFLD